MTSLQTIETKLTIHISNQTGELLRVFLSGRSKQTVVAYRQDLMDFRDFLGAESPEEASAVLLSKSLGEANRLVLRYKNNLLERKFQPATINRRLAAIRSLTKMARMVGMIPWSLEIENAKSQPYKDVRGPGKSAFQKMLKVAASQRNNVKAIRDRAILRLLYDLALRASEVTQLDLSDLDLQSGMIAVLGKGQSEKMNLSLPLPTQKALVQWLEVRGTEAGPLLTNVDRAKKGNGRMHRNSLFRLVRDLGSKIGIKTRTHAIRHLSITQACIAANANGIPIEEVLDFSRHRSLKTLLVYRDRERNIQKRLAELVAQIALENEPCM